MQPVFLGDLRQNGSDLLDISGNVSFRASALQMHTVTVQKLKYCLKCVNLPNIYSKRMYHQVNIVFLVDFW